MQRRKPSLSCQSTGKVFYCISGNPECMSEDIKNCCIYAAVRICILIIPRYMALKQREYHQYYPRHEYLSLYLLKGLN